MISKTMGDHLQNLPYYKHCTAVLQILFLNVWLIPIKIETLYSSW